MKIAEQYVAAFNNLAQKGNTVIIPSTTNDVSSMVAQVSNLLHMILKINSLIEYRLNIFFRLLGY